MSEAAITPDYWQDAKVHLSKADPVLAKIIKQYKGETLKARGSSYYTLTRSIVGQQISVKAADSIWQRFEVLHKAIQPGHTLKLADEQLREIGLSRSKVTYVKEIAKFFEQHRAEPDWPEYDAELLALLTSIKGVGVWTAEMFMIFHLLKPDVLPIGDIGLLKAIGLHYGDGSKASKEDTLTHGQRWQPYRSVATWYLWRSLDPVPVEY